MNPQAKILNDLIAKQSPVLFSLLSQKGKAAIQAAAIGIIIILSAWLIVNFTINAVTRGEIGGQANIFDERPAAGIGEGF